MKLIYILFLFCYYQAYGQGILILEVPGTVKNYKFYENDKIEFLLRPYDQVVKGRIVRLSKNTLVIDSYSAEIAIDSITTIYTTREGLRFFGELFLKAGLGYFVVGSVNLLINDDHAGLIKEPVLIGGSVAVTGALMLYFRRRVHVIDNRKWRLVVIDDSE